jgi:HEAT repeat protein
MSKMFDLSGCSSHASGATFRCSRLFFGLILAAVLQAGACVALAQTPTTTPDQNQNQAKDADGKIVESAPVKPKTPAELHNQAWTMLTDAVNDEKHAETRVQALAAVGLLGSNQRSLDLLRKAMQDKDVDIRVAAVVAAGQTKSPNITTDLRRMLDDKEPAVAFAAALTLWKMHDRSGEDILTAVADGDRKATAKFINGTEHTISKQLHDPTALAKYGALQGASLLLGPFGMGIGAYEYLHKNGGDSARVSAIEAIAQNHTDPIRTELLSALTDKDLGVRAAAAKALARYHEPEVPPALAKVFDDTKPPVRLTAAAAYLISTGAAVGSPVEGENLPRPARH